MPCMFLGFPAQTGPILTLAQQHIKLRALPEKLCVKPIVISDQLFRTQAAVDGQKCDMFIIKQGRNFHQFMITILLAQVECRSLNLTFLIF